MKRNWVLIQFADESLMSNENFILEAIEIDGRAVKYAHENLQKKRTIALAAVTQNGLALASLPEFSGDEEVVLRAIRQNPTAFQYASEEIRFKGKILMIALRQPIPNDLVSPLKFTSPELQQNRFVVRTAMDQDQSALKFASPFLQKALSQEAQTQ